MSTSTIIMPAAPRIEALSLNFLSTNVPAIYAAAPSPRTSSKYRFINTAEVLAGLAEAGFLPVNARQARTKDFASRDFARHLIRLRHSDYSLIVGDVIPELLLINSHSGSSAFAVHAGLHRVQCQNGLVTPVGEFGHLVVPHRASIVTDVVDAARELTAHFLPLLSTVNLMRGVVLTEAERTSLATRAAALKYGEVTPPFPISKLLEPKRFADVGDNLFTIVNVLQEHLVRGGISYSRPYGRRAATRKLASITEEIRINTGLWKIAQTYLPPTNPVLS
jgi:hypothetical protein